MIETEGGLHNQIERAAKGSAGHTFSDHDLPLQRIYASESHRPTQPFLTQPRDRSTQTWTWAEAMHEARRIAAWLVAQNFPAASRVVILSRNCAWWIMADFAIWMAGHISVPLYASLRKESIGSLFEHCEPAVCFLGDIDEPPPSGLASLQSVRFVTLPTCRPAHQPPSAERWNDLVSTHDALSGQRTRDANEVATIIYTSGTTGRPKGVMQSFRALSLMGMSMDPVLGNSPLPLDRILSYLPLAHVAERAIVEMNALLLSLEIFFTEGQPTFLTDLHRSECTVFFSIPQLYLRFQQGVFEKVPSKKLGRLLKIPILNRLVRRKVLAGLGLQHTRLVASGGAAIPVDLILWYRDLGLNFVEGYGTTETGITHVPLPGRFRAGYVGNASICAETRISDSGEVQIKGPMNMVGYYKDAELTRQSFTDDGFFHTGDRGEIDDSGRLRIVGRLKEEFKTAKGKYVYPGPIEKLLSMSTLFESVCVLGSGLANPFLLAVLVPELREAARNVAERAHIQTRLQAQIDRTNQSLEPHEQMRFIVVCQQPWTIENGLLTPTLKVRLEQRFAHSLGAWERMQQRVLWEEVAL
jgi:long-chain acyl-CoA synthetase